MTAPNPHPLWPTQVMERLIEFAYTASISVGEKCVIHVMNGAVMYQIDSVVKACCDFLVQQLDPSNAIGIANFAEQIGCTELHQKAREYIYLNFSQVRLHFATCHNTSGRKFRHIGGIKCLFILLTMKASKLCVSV